MPNAVAYLFHHLPVQVHHLEVAMTFAEQLVLPFFFFAPWRVLRVGAAVAELWFQFMIVLTGNYAWINFIGALPVLALLDDDVWATCWRWLSGAVSVMVPAAARAAKAAAAPAPSHWWCRLQRWLGLAASCGLVAVMCVKSTDPLKELFKPSPWLARYDDYYLISAQGVFGFINQERTVLLAEFTHDALPPCHGRQCAALNTSALHWTTLAFKNLPADLDRAPRWNSPYHYRLSWQVWIETTASMEGRPGPLAVPQFLQTLFAKVLLGDTDAAELLGVPRADLLVPGYGPPTAIRTRYFKYRFSQPEQLWQHGRWWTRKRVKGDQELVFRKELFNVPRDFVVVHSAPGRVTMLLLSVFGVVLAVCSRPGVAAVPLACLHVLVFGLLLRLDLHWATPQQLAVIITTALVLQLGHARALGRLPACAASTFCAAGVAALAAASSSLDHK